MLLAALVGPFFVDWTAYRQAFENQAENLLGHRVKVLGTADARLFPVPSLTFTDVLIGEPEKPLMTVDRFEADIELTPLIKGEVRVLDMRMDSPELELALDPQGRLSWFAEGTGSPRIPLDPQALSIGSLTVQNGRISLADAASGHTYRLDNVNFRLEARSLFGPYKVDGAAAVDGVPINLQLGTGVFRADQGLQVKMKLTPANVPLSIALDGLVASETGKLTYAGSLNAERVVEEGSEAIPVRATASFTLNSDVFAADEIDLTVGSEDRSLRVEGATVVSLGRDPKFSADLIARQIDLDRTLGQGPSDPLTVGEAFALVTGAIRDAPEIGLPGRVIMRMPGVVVAGGLMENVELKAATRSSGWAIESVTGTLPGRSAFAAEGLIGVQPRPTFSGRMLLRSAQPASLIAWLDPAAGQIGRLEPVEIDASLSARPEAVEVDTFSLVLGESTVSGSGNWFAETGERPASLSLTVTADSIDLDRYLDSAGMANLVSRYTAPAAGLDSLIKVAAGTIRIGAVDVQGIDINAAFADGALIVDRFHIDDLAGAELDASGTVERALTTPNGTFDLSVFASDVTGLIKVLGVLYPDSGIIAELRRRRSVLAPVALTGRLEAGGKADATAATLRLQGDLGSTTVDHTLTFAGRVDAWRDAEIDLKLEADSEDGALLLRQLGFDVLPIAAAEDGALSVQFAGVPRAGLTGSAALAAGPASARYDGEVRLQPDGRVGLSGETAAETDDLASSLLLVGKMVPILAGRIPVKLSAAVSGFTDDVTLDRLKGSFGEDPLAGALKLDRTKQAPRLSGNLSLAMVDARFLSELALGADAWSAVDGSSSSGWPSAAFGPPLLAGLDYDIEVEAAKLAWDDTFTVSEARFSTRMKGDELTVDGLRGKLFGGGLSGAFSISRAAGAAVLSAHAQLEDAALEAFVWKRDGRPVASGVLDLAFNVEGSGRSIASIVSGLSGGGTVRLTDGVLRSMNTGAFDAVIRAADAGLELDDGKIRSVFAGHLDSGTLEFDEISGSFTMASGVARARNVAISTPSATAFGGAAVDLGRWTVESDWSIKVDPGAEDAVAGAEPEVGLVFSGPLDAPERKLDTAPLLAYLTLRAFEQEVRRVEALQAEILERDRLLRELKLRRQELAALRAEEAAEEETAPPADGTPAPQGTAPGPAASPPGDSSAAPTRRTTPVSQSTGTRRAESGAPREDARQPEKPPESFADRIRRTLDGGSAPAGPGPFILGPLPPPVTFDRAPGG